MASLIDQVFAAIDAANSKDPTLEDGQPAALIYGQRMTAEQEQLFPDASTPLRIACRGQHIERWLLPRDHFPMDRAGYFQWRTEQGRRHSERVVAIMEAAGYDGEACDRVRMMLTKQGIKRNAEVQALEDVACFTFIRWYMGDFAAGQPDGKMPRIIEKTARKMSAEARAKVLQQFDIPADFVHFFQT